MDAARRLAARRGDPVRIEGVRDPKDPDAALYETAALLPGPDAEVTGPRGTVPGTGSSVAAGGVVSVLMACAIVPPVPARGPLSPPDGRRDLRLSP